MDRRLGRGGDNGSAERIAIAFNLFRSHDHRIDGGASLPRSRVDCFEDRPPFLVQALGVIAGQFAFGPQDPQHRRVIFGTLVPLSVHCIATRGVNKLRCGVGMSWKGGPRSRYRALVDREWSPSH